ncbi:CDP-diacylglycerol--inositol 3-phosphatidyltransferase [bacterium BMS3Bbin06]|nr:CDP-diacylglycerol--inositol 3-phosphatidyltransferase [bacterium BMS3Abin08]GBE35722.1 CDP-diacylglycerol--inositol 3-phosphatidyltransferase [bacterium BMS3Bbin06]HDO36502.1 CDP-alcohol phosphatidyltransferase family protein [Nitrospirota bacterium]HDY70191.1 CDP-alcohol phosphatidyltransferase family protein [Nitrospirota bacterium]
MISAWFGHFLDKPLEPLARHVRVTPNFFTVTGFLITSAAAITIPLDHRLGGVLILAGGAFDILDGVVARTNGKETDFGAFLDSLLDRYSDAFILIAIAWLMLLDGKNTAAVLSIGTLVGAFLVSYARARAEGLGFDCHTGLMERPERIILISAACISGYFVPVLWILFILTHLTVIQRILHVRRLSSK